MLGNDDKQPTLWDLTSLRQVGASQNDCVGVNNALAFSPDGTQLAIASSSKTVTLYDAGTGRPTGTALQHEGNATALAYSPYGNRLATISQTETPGDRRIRLWDTTTRTAVATVEVKNIRPSTMLDNFPPNEFIAFSSRGSFLAAAFGDDAVRLWDIGSGMLQTSLLHSSSDIDAMAFSPYGMHLAAGSDDGTSSLWRISSGSPTFISFPHVDTVVQTQFSPDGQIVATASLDTGDALWSTNTVIRLWNTPSGKSYGYGIPIRVDGQIGDFTFSPDGTRIATASLDSTARIFDTTTGSATTVPMQHSDRLIAVVFSRDGTRLATASRDATARLWESATGRPIGKRMPHNGPVNTLTFSPDGTRLVTGSADRTARLWSTLTGEPLGAEMKHDGPVAALTFSPDGTRMATAAGSVARLWDALTGAPIGSPMSHKEQVNSVTFSIDGNVVLTVEDGKQTRLWDGRTGAPVTSPVRYPDATAMAISRDLRYVATAAKSVVQIWDVDTGTPLSLPRSVPQDENQLGFSNDGKYLAITGYGAVEVLRLPDAWTEAKSSLLQQTCGFTLANKLSIFTNEELKFASELNPAYDADVCTSPTLVALVTRSLGFHWSSDSGK